MIKNFTLLFLFCFIAHQAQSQYSDTLLIVKDHLQFIKNTVSKKNSPAKATVGILDSLIRSGTDKEEQFKRNLSKLVNAGERDYNEMVRAFHFIYQSLVLLKTDLKANNYLLNENSQNELIYLNRNIPALIDKIYYYLNVEKNKKLLNTYGNGG